MTELPAPHSVVGPGTIVAAILGLLLGAVSMAFNPLIAVSVIAIALCLVTLRGATRVENAVVRGLLRIFAVIGIMAALGGVVALFWR